jgi:hypothetical protein
MSEPARNPFAPAPRRHGTTLGNSNNGDDAINMHPTSTHPDAPTQLDSANQSTGADSNLQNKVRELLIELKFVTNGGTQFELAIANRMERDAFFAYKETLKQCKPRFRFDRDGAITGTERVWYRRIGAVDRGEARGEAKRNEQGSAPPAKRRKKRDSDKDGTEVAFTPADLEVLPYVEACVHNIGAHVIKNTADLRRIIGAICAAGDEYQPLAGELYAPQGTNA